MILCFYLLLQTVIDTYKSGKTIRYLIENQTKKPSPNIHPVILKLKNEIGH